jgi:hypothetical protein
MPSRFLCLLLCCACTATAPPKEEYAARRSDVTASLHRQLDLVLARQARLEGRDEPGDLEERAELLRLAAEIALQILQVDQFADAEALVKRVERARSSMDEATP